MDIEVIRKGIVHGMLCPILRNDPCGCPAGPALKALEEFQKKFEINLDKTPPPTV